MLKDDEKGGATCNYLLEAKKIKSFKDLNLNDRLNKAVAKVKWAKPTLVQAATIPLSIEGRDIICKSKTGSGTFEFVKIFLFIISCYLESKH